MQFIKLNPYQEIDEVMRQFIRTHYGAVKGIVLTLDPNDNPSREVCISKGIFNADDELIGLINIDVLNQKYAASNVKTNTAKLRDSIHVSAGNSTANAEVFAEDFVDTDDRLEFRLTIKQFMSKAMAMSEVSLSMVGWTTAGKTAELNSLIHSIETNALHWEDPAMVVAVKHFFEKYGEAALTGWTPAAADVTKRTIFVLAK